MAVASLRFWGCFFGSSCEHCGGITNSTNYQEIFLLHFITNVAVSVMKLNLDHGRTFSQKTTLMNCSQLSSVVRSKT